MAINYKWFIDINQFYSRDKPPSSITFGIPEIVLDVENSQKYLVQYHNIIVEAFNYILDKIYIKELERD